MTKTKKKTTKSSLVIILMAIALVALIAFGGAYAYFTATAKSGSTSFTTGYVHLTSGDSKYQALTGIQFPSPTNYIIGDANSSDTNPAAVVTVGTDDTKGNYVAVQFAIKFYRTVSDVKTEITGEKYTRLIAALGWGEAALATGKWAAVTDAGVLPNVYVYTDASAPKAVKNGDKATILSKALVFDADDNWDETASEDTTTNPNYISEKELMGVEIEITLVARSIQATGMPTENLALTIGKTLFPVPAAPTPEVMP